MEENTYLNVDEASLKKIEDRMPPEEELQAEMAENGGLSLHEAAEGGKIK